MAMLDDHGLEVIKKAGQSADPSNKSDTDYFLRTLQGWVMQAPGRNIQFSETSTTETFTYKQDSTIVYVILATYTDSTKETILSVERTT